MLLPCYYIKMACYYSFTIVISFKWNDLTTCAFTCVDSQVFSEIAGIAEGFAAVATLVWSHAHVPHEMHI